MVEQALYEKKQLLKANVERTQEGSRLKAILFLLAAAETVHTLIHVWIGISGVLPMSVLWFPSFTITHEVNLLAIVLNGIITFGLLDAAMGLKK
jgi:hypothetical protein